MKIFVRVFIFLISIILAACSSQPRLIQATAEPEQAAIGESVDLTVEFDGGQDELKTVYLTVREHPSEFPMIQLDVAAGAEKNIWSREIAVPYDAYPGDFHLDINAFLHSGEEIISEGFEQNSTGKAGTILLKVK